MEKLSYEGNNRKAMLDAAALKSDGWNSLKMYMYEIWVCQLDECKCGLLHVSNIAKIVLSDGL